jgi:N-acetylmuramic acid 6-phosphate etherase
LSGRSSTERLLGFDFSAQGPAAGSDSVRFRISAERDSVSLALGQFTHRLALKNATSLCRHLVLKMLLNAHSTIVMGRLGRYDGNVMTWVKPSCNKLVDRAVRYAGLLLNRRGVVAPYEQIAKALFETVERQPAGESVVHAVVRTLAAQ